MAIDLAKKALEIPIRLVPELVFAALSTSEGVFTFNLVPTRPRGNAGQCPRGKTNYGDHSFRFA
jgi:hypothetical protein